MTGTWKINTQQNNIVEMTTNEVIAGLNDGIISPNTKVFDSQSNSWKNISQMQQFVEYVAPGMQIKTEKAEFWWAVFIPFVNIPVRYIYQHRLMKTVGGDKKASSVMIYSIIADIIFFIWWFLARLNDEIGYMLTEEIQMTILIFWFLCLLGKIILNFKVWGEIGKQYNKFINYCNLSDAPEVNQSLFNIRCWIGAIPILGWLPNFIIMPICWYQLTRAINYFADNNIWIHAKKNTN